VHDDPGRLVDDEQVLVLVGDPERQLLGLEARLRLGGLEGDLLATLESMTLGPRLAVDEYRVLGQKPLRRGARADLAQRGEEPVEPLPRGFRRNPCDRQVLRVSPTTSARKRIATPITMNESARLKAGQ
jgi:hypothetical protein